MSLRTVNLEMSFCTGSVVSPILRGIDLDFPGGSFTAIMGPSGSGKTTLLYCLSGILKPTAGQVFLDEQDIAAHGANVLDELRRTSLGFVFQNYNLIDALSAWQNVSLPSLFGGEKVSRPSAISALERVGLKEVADRYPDELSGGQRQRVAIARALAAHRHIVFADEPTGALDSSAGKEVMAQFSHILESGASIVLVTHDPSIAAYASRVVFLYDGRIADSLDTPTAQEISNRLTELAAD